MRSSGGTRHGSRTEALAIALCLWAVSAFAASPDADPSLTVEPKAFELWRDRTATLTVETGQPVDEVRVSASRGQLDAPVRVGPGRFTVQWRPPDEGFPQLALFCAHVRSGTSWRPVSAVLPLWGLGDAVVRATPNSKITVRIGDRKYGPVLTNGSGTARVPVEVRPGESEALHGSQRIPLDVPETPRAHAAAVEDSVWASRPSTVHVALLAAAPDGSLLETGNWELGVDRGSVSAPVLRSPGLWEVTWSIPAGAPGELHLHAQLTHDAMANTQLQLTAKSGSGSQSFEARNGQPDVSGAVEPQNGNSLVSVTPRVGVVSNFSDVTAVELGVQVSRLQPIGPGQLVAGLEVGTFQFGPPRNTLGVSGQSRYIPALLEAGYRLGFGRVGVGALLEGGAARVQNAQTVAGSPETRSSGWVPAGAVELKLEWALWHGGAQVSARGLIAGDPQLSTLSGRFVGLSLGAGYRFEL